MIQMNSQVSSVTSGEPLRHSGFGLSLGQAPEEFQLPKTNAIFR